MSTPDSNTPESTSKLVAADPDTYDDMWASPDGPDGLWHCHERLVLNDGTVVVRRSAAFETEPHLGDIMDTAGGRVMQMLIMARDTGVLRFLPDDEGLFFTPLSNVQGIYVDVYGPGGAEIPAGSLKPGRYQPGQAD